MERQEDGSVRSGLRKRVSLADQRCRRVWPGARRAGPPKAEAGAGAGPAARAARRLDLYTA